MSLSMTRPVRLVALLAAGVVLLGGATTSLAAGRPNPPITARYSVKGFVGGTKRVILAVYPPLTFADNTSIPAGAKVEAKVYRSYDGGKTYGTKGVSIVEQKYVDFTNPETGQNRFDPARIAWIEVVCETPVDPPKAGSAIDLLGVTPDGSPSAQQDTTVCLAASIVVNGVESDKTNQYLTFRYAVSGIPGLVRYETPNTTGQPVTTQLTDPPPEALADRGGLWSGEYMLTAIAITDALRKSPQFQDQGCQQALAQLEAARGKKTPLTVKVTSMVREGAPTPAGHGVYTGTADVTMQPIGGQGQAQQFRGDMVYIRHRSCVIITDTVEKGALEMTGNLMETATDYEIEGPFRFRLIGDGKELLILHGMWLVKRQK